MTETVVVGSENPSKLEAVRLGFQAVFPGQEFVFLTFEVSSGVSSQPFGDQETLTGAENRARAVRNFYPDGDFWVGLEGGLSKLDGDHPNLAAYSWIYILGKNNAGYARSASYILPEKVSNLIYQGMEQGEADDIVFGQENSKQASGGVGLLTNDLITRADLYAMAVKLALIPFHQEKLYPNIKGKAQK